jgi:hypothetical protein
MTANIVVFLYVLSSLGRVRADFLLFLMGVRGSPGGLSRISAILRTLPPFTQKQSAPGKPAPDARLIAGKGRESRKMALKSRGIPHVGACRSWQMVRLRIMQPTSSPRIVTRFSKGRGLHG